MNKREDALIEALQRNAEETERWKSYLKENETAKENLSIFQKRLSVEVMVPVGKKALMPGHLIHTNEVLVGHYQGYFSKCSAFKAGEICDLRIRAAKEHLNKLETELEMWQNKLEKPYAEGMMPTGEEREIIEDFNEEKEQLWKEQHKLRLKLAKQKEKEKRDAVLTNEADKHKAEDQPTDKYDMQVLKMLDEAELMEELEQELENLEIDEVNDETIRKLMAGEIKLPPNKKRVANESESKDEQEKEETPLSIKIVKKVSLHNIQQPFTNNNVIPNPDLSLQNDNVENSDDDNEEEDEALPEEVTIIKEQAMFLNNEDRIGFYEYQIEIIRQKVMSLPQRSQEQIDEKIRLFNVLEHLEELLEIAETTLGNVELIEQEENEEDTEIKETENDIQTIAKLTENEIPNKANPKRRISFALEDETLEFCKTEAVTQMLPDKREKHKRDIITLDDNTKEEEKEIIPTSMVIDKKHYIQAKVEQNRQFVSETQSKHDFDLVHKILESSIGKINTLHINFKHSPQLPANASTNDNKDLEIPASPADFYLKYLDLSKVTETSTLFINSYEGEDKVKTPILKELDKQQAFKDPKAEFSNPKSILRNKLAIEKENHYPDTQPEDNEKKQKKKKRTPKEEEDSLSAYNMVMNDVVEKPANEPEPLPDGKYIDAHTPKRRVSRFKQMRQGTEKT